MEKQLNVECFHEFNKLTMSPETDLTYTFQAFSFYYVLAQYVRIPGLTLSQTSPGFHVSAEQVF